MFWAHVQLSVSSSGKETDTLVLQRVQTAVGDCNTRLRAIKDDKLCVLKKRTSGQPSK
jgi:hypothetical protein